MATSDRYLLPRYVQCFFLNRFCMPSLKSKAALEVFLRGEFRHLKEGGKKETGRQAGPGESESRERVQKNEAKSTSQRFLFDPILLCVGADNSHGLTCNVPKARSQVCDALIPGPNLVVI